MNLHAVIMFDSFLTEMFSWKTKHVQWLKHEHLPFSNLLTQFTFNTNALQQVLQVLACKESNAWNIKD
jgi:hypothetical protein